MAYDTATRQLVLFGGLGPPGHVSLSTTWAWNGTTWVKLTPSTSPPASFGASMAYDAATGQLILFGGSSASGPLSTTWVWNGTTWVKLLPATSPPASGSMAYDPHVRQLVLFGGVDTSGYISTTWTWNGTTWEKLAPATSPSGRSAAPMAYDTATGQFLLFGGFNGTSQLSTTWTWNGTTWTELSQATSPPARDAASMAYDTATGQLVLFGGYARAHGFLSTTWEWNGTTWVKLLPATSPAARGAASMAYDRAVGQLMLFGGTSSSTRLSTTWVLVSSTSRASSKRVAALTDVSCSTAAACTAVGDYYSEPPLHYGSLVLRWNAKAWHRQRAPAIGPATITTVAVSCPTDRRCVAVGASGAMVWNGARWKTQRDVTGDAVSCPSGVFCVAVMASAQRLTSEIWKDGRWTSHAMPLPTAPMPIQSTTVSGVSCTSARFCMAVGDYIYGTSALPSPSRRNLTLAEVWNGDSWRLVHPVKPATLASLKAVSCRSARFCVAVGTTRTQFTLAERWTGEGWKVQASPNPSRVGYSVLDAVDCPSTHVCEAVGDYDGASLIAESWSKDRWSLQRMRTPGTVITSPPALSCPSTDACVAVGAVDGRPLSQTWNGHSWTTQRTPNPLQ